MHQVSFRLGKNTTVVHLELDWTGVICRGIVRLLAAKTLEANKQLISTSALPFYKNNSYDGGFSNQL